jgi:hypothetical protein
VIRRISTSHSLQQRNQTLVGCWKFLKEFIPASLFQLKIKPRNQIGISLEA